MRGWDKAQWDPLSPLLDRALDLEPAERSSFLADVRRDDPDAGMALERLLAEHDQVLVSAFLEGPPMDAGVPASLAGQTVGAYTLERPLGMGGMGMVWLARRSDGRFEGNVAVKLVNLALLDPAGQERFRREGTLLARLSHPHIARLLDAGVTPAGQPFLILEYVEGSRIDHFADEHRLSIDARLAIFLQVADAVSHAHANLIVHRDLKPSNILVDAHGQVKLLDFGIATLIDSGSAAEPLTVGGGHALSAGVRRARADFRRERDDGDRRVCAWCRALPTAGGTPPNGAQREYRRGCSTGPHERRAASAQWRGRSIDKRG